MNFILKRLNISNFKGIREKTIDFDETFTRIEGKNATFKTTTMDAFFWAINDTDSELKSNPNVFPIDVAECSPEVEVIFSVDGKVNRIKRTQTRKITDGNGVQKTATSNTYSFNDVPMAQRDVSKKLEELGVDLEKFEIISHINCFLSMKKDDQRKLLFEMANTLSDLDIAERLGSEASEVAEQLAQYTTTEIRAMANASLKKINDVYGKKGELLQAKIEGLENAKVEVDLSAAELLKNDLNEKLAKNNEKRIHNADIQKNLDILQQKNMDLQFELSGMKNSLSATKQANLEKIKKEVESAKEDLTVKANRYKELQAERDSTNKKLEYAIRELETAKDLMAKAEALEFDPAAEKCPTCGQKLPDTDIAKLHENFNNDKAKKVNNYKNDISEAETLITGYKASLKNLDDQIEKCKNDGKAVQDVYTAAVEKFNTYKQIPDSEPTEDIKTKEKELAEINAKMQELKSSYIPNVDLEEVDLRQQMSAVDKDFAQGEANNRIDEKISDLREMQKEYEQNRANNEKLLYQLDLIQKQKNILLADEINSHFNLVHFKFFDYLKNGSYAEVVVPMVKDKELGAALNNAMQIRAKVDICNGLQKFYNQHLPLWLDNAEALDTDNQRSLETDTQMILLAVKD